MKLVFDQNDMSSHTVSQFELVIKNFGMGPALDCTVTYKINSTDKAGEFCLEPQDGVGLGHWANPRRHHILGAGDEMGLSTEALQYQLGKDDCIEGVLTYHSVFEQDGKVSEPFWFIVNSELSSHITTITVHRGKPIQE